MSTRRDIISKVLLANVMSVPCKPPPPSSLPVCPELLILNDVIMTDTPAFKEEEERR